MMRLLNTSPHIVVGEPYPFERKYFAYLFRWARLLDRREWPKRWVGRSFGSLTQEERTPLMGPLRGFREICCAHPAASRRCRSTASTWHGGSSRTVPGRSKGIERASATTPRSTWTRGSSTWRSCHRSRSSSCFATPVTPISRSGHSTGSGASLATRAHDVARGLQVQGGPAGLVHRPAAGSDALDPRSPALRRGPRPGMESRRDQREAKQPRGREAGTVDHRANQWCPGLADTSVERGGGGGRGPPDVDPANRRPEFGARIAIDWLIRSVVHDDELIRGRVDPALHRRREQRIVLAISRRMLYAAMTRETSGVVRAAPPGTRCACPAPRRANVAGPGGARHRARR